MRNWEDQIKEQVQSDVSTAYAFSSKYVIVDISKLITLIELVQQGCNQCLGQQCLSHYEMDGHAFKLVLQCPKCGIVLNSIQTEVLW